MSSPYPLPEVRFTFDADQGFACYVNGRIVTPDDVLDLGDGRLTPLVDCLIFWSRSPERTAAEIARAQRFVAAYIDAMREVAP